MTSEQDERAHRAALDWAGTARRRREQVRVDLRNGDVDLAAVLAARTEDPDLGVVRLLWVLESVPGARKISTRRALDAMGIDQAMPLAAIDDPLCAVLVERFADPAELDR